jgi:hypothetical protein
MLDKRLLFVDLVIEVSGARYNIPTQLIWHIISKFEANCQIFLTSYSLEGLGCL